MPAIDGFRGYAAVMVLLIHVTYGSGRPPLDEGFIRSVLVSGYVGVDFFFVISGFVLFLPGVTNGGRLGNLRSYAERRTARILPAYYLMLVGIVVLHPLLTSPVDLPYNSLRGALSFLLHLTFLEHTVGMVLGLPLGFVVNAAVWSLTVEVLFYALLPLVCGWYYRRPLVGLAVALLLASLWKILATSDVLVFVAGGRPYDLRFAGILQLPNYLGHFAAGMTAAWLYVRLRSAGNRRLVNWAAVSAQVLAFAVIVLTMRSAGMRDLIRGGHPYFDASGNWQFEHWTQTTHVGVAFAVLILATALAPRWAQWPATNRLARGVGNASYGIYLWHFPLIWFAITTLHFAPDGTDWAFFRLLAFTLTGSLIFGWLSFTLVERPFIRWAQRRSRRRDLQPPGPAAMGSDVVPATSLPEAAGTSTSAR